MAASVLVPAVIASLNSHDFYIMRRGDGEGWSGERGGVSACGGRKKLERLLDR